MSEKPPKQQLRGLIFCHFRGIASGPFRQIRDGCSSAVTAAAAVPDEYMQLAVHTVVVKVKKFGHILDSSLHHLLHVRFSFPVIFLTAGSPPFSLSLDVLVVEIKVLGEVLGNCLDNLLHGKISFHRIWQTQPSAWASLSEWGGAPSSGVFSISLSTDLQPDPASKPGDATTRDRWGE